MVIKDIVSRLERLAPPIYQESYDNSGLLVGNAHAHVNKALVCLDCIEEVVDEAIRENAGLIVAHHPIVFSGLKRLNGKHYIERVVMKAIKNDIAIYAIHTNLDNVQDGVNKKIAEKLGVENPRILLPKTDVLFKLVTYCPKSHTEAALQAMFEAGAGQIGNYDECSFAQEGTGTYRAGDGANPFKGEKYKRHHEPEDRIEVLVPLHAKNQIIVAMLAVHPYEEVAYDLHKLENAHTTLGAGMIGTFRKEMSESEFLQHVKTTLQTACIRHTAKLGKPVKTVAFCGGSGSFLLPRAIRAKADAFITGDFKYHQFFDADGKIMIADVGHFESEQFTIDLIADYLMEKFPTFAVLKTGVNTNPIAYV